MNKRPPPTLQQALQLQLDTLAVTLRPGTVDDYATIVRRFLNFLHQAHPHINYPSQLQRDPHLLDFLQSLHRQQPPLHNSTRIEYLILLRRLLRDLVAGGHSLAEDLIGPQDFPPPDVYLPKPLSAEDDALLARQLAQDNDLLASALRLLRATGLRIGECRNLSVDCLHTLATNQWVLKVPLGKLHTERWLPVDDSCRQIITRILVLRCPGPTLSPSNHFLLQWRGGRRPCHSALARRLDRAAAHAGCSTHLNPHRLRHSFATEMISAGVSLPVVMRLLGHNDIRMTLRYVHVSQNDMQREYHRARQNLADRHRLPTLPIHELLLNHPQGGLLALQNALAAIQHLLASYRLTLSADIFTMRLASRANRKRSLSTDKLRR